VTCSSVGILKGYMVNKNLATPSVVDNDIVMRRKPFHTASKLIKSKHFLFDDMAQE